MRQLHREFLRAGADVIQAYTFSYDDDLDGDHAKYGVSTAYYYISIDIYVHFRDEIKTTNDVLTTGNPGSLCVPHR